MIKLVIFDFDGVFTDGKFYFNEKNLISKSYNAKDALALEILRDHNIKTAIITNDKVVSIEKAPHIFPRINKCSVGEDKPKIEILDQWLLEYDLNYADIAYMGDDLSDIDILKKVGFSSCPNDAIEEVKQIVNFVSKSVGGNGAVREFVGKILERNQVKNNFFFSV